MKKIIVPALLIIVNTSYSQNPIEGVLRTYFHTHPFNKKGFTNFIATLQKDRWFKIDEYRPGTDSSFFFLTGTYKYFNPFRYIPEELRLSITEVELTYPAWNDRDTIIVMQLTGITDTASENKKIVQKEFRRFHNNQAYRFRGFYTYRYYGDKKQKTAEVYNYYIFPSVEPLTVAWGSLPETNQYSFAITIRFTLKKNTADAIIFPRKR